MLNACSVDIVAEPEPIAWRAPWGIFHNNRCHFVLPSSDTCQSKSRSKYTMITQVEVEQLCGTWTPSPASTRVDSTFRFPPRFARVHKVSYANAARDNSHYDARCDCIWTAWLTFHGHWQDRDHENALWCERPVSKPHCAKLTINFCPAIWTAYACAVAIGATNKS